MIAAVPDSLAMKGTKTPAAAFCRNFLLFIDTPETPLPQSLSYKHAAPTRS